MAIIFLSPNINLATIFLKPKYYLGNYFTKPKIPFWQKQLLYTQSPNVILAHAYKTQILFLTLALQVLSPSLMGNMTIHPSRNISLTRFIKAHVHHSWQNYSSCRVSQAQASLSTEPSKVKPAQTQISTSGEHVNWSAKFQQQLKQLEPLPIRS